MILLLLSACVWLMDRPPKCPDSCPGHFACSSSGLCNLTCSSNGGGGVGRGCEEGYYCDFIYEDCEPVCEDEACPDHLSCDGDTACNYYCENNADCQSGYRCNDYGECVN